MRIMHITPSLNTGGAEIFSFQLCEALERRGHKVILLSISEPTKDDVLFERLKRAKFEFISLGKISGNGPSLKVPFQIRSIVKEWKPAIVNTHLRALAYSVLVPGGEIDRFHTVHSMAKKEAGMHLRKLNQLQFWRGWKPIAISNKVAESILEVYKIRAPKINNGVERPLFSPDRANFWRQELGLSGSEKVVLHIGRLTAVKNQLSLLNAFSRLAANDPTLHLVLVGDDPEIGKPYLEEINQAIAKFAPKISQRVHLLGLRRDIGDLLAAADVFVLCSLYEGLPLALLEAMSFGLKCVCINVGGIPDAISPKSGWLVKPNCPKSLRKSLSEALHSTASEKGNEAKNTFDQEFTIDSCAHKYELLYNK